MLTCSCFKSASDFDTTLEVADLEFVFVILHFPSLLEPTFVVLLYDNSLFSIFLQAKK